MIEEQVIENKNEELVRALKKVGMLALISMIGGMVYGIVVLETVSSDYSSATSTLNALIGIVQDVGIFKLIYGTVVAQMISGILYGMVWQGVRFTKKDFGSFNFKNCILLTSLMILTYTIVSLLNIVFPNNPHASMIYLLRALYLGARLESSYLYLLVLFHGFIFPILEVLLIQGVVLKTVQSHNKTMAIFVSSLIAISFYFHPVVALQLFAMAMVLSIFQVKRPSLLTLLVSNVLFHVLALNNVVPIYTDVLFLVMMIIWSLLFLFSIFWVIKKRKEIVSFVKENTIHKEDISTLLKARSFVVYLILYFISAVVTNVTYR